MTIQILPELSIAYLLIFARIGTLVMLLPGVGESMFPVRIRLSVALLMALVFYPFALPYYPQPMGTVPQIIGLLLQEILIGFVLGVMGRLMVSALQTAGAIVAQQLGLGFVVAVDPTMGQQGALVGTFLSLMGIALIFALDLHHLVIAALGKSYDIFRPGTMPPVDDAFRYVVGLVSSSFKIAVQISAPFIVFGLIFNIGLGVLAKLMPQMQVFFIAVPASIMIGFIILALVLGAMMTVFTNYMESGLRQLLQLGG